MKNTIRMLSFFTALLLCVLSVGCSEKKGSEIYGESSVTEENVKDNTENTETHAHIAEEKLKVTESYLKKGLKKDIENMRNASKPYSMTGGPYAIAAPDGIGNGVLKSISVFVYKTQSADSDGNFEFTLFVFDEIDKSPKRSYKIYINGAKCGLKENSDVKKFVEIDTEEYSIKLDKNEILAYLSPDDTVVPGYFPSGTVNYQITEKCPMMYGFWSHMGTEGVRACTGSLLYDFKWEREYSCKEEYDRALAEKNMYIQTVDSLKDKYKGKNVSILGDSISTFAGVSNNTSANSTTGGNAVYYGSSRLPTEENTYWGRIINDIGMNLCVNNSFSGAKAVSKGADSGVLRSTELHRNDGTKPDLVIVYLGTNDLHSNTPVGSLAEDMTYGKYSKDALDTWFKGVLDSTDNGKNAVSGENYNSFDEAYALILHKIKQTYKDAEIICVNLVPTNHAAFNKEKMEKMNFVIDCLSEYFGATFADQNGHTGINENTCKYYTLDYPNSIHLSASGHFLLSKEVLKAMSK